MKNYKEIVPNILTVSRIFITPIMIILSILNKFKIVVFLAIVCAITDLIDGKLARKWNTVSTVGAKLDCVADKVFGIGTILCLILKSKSFIFVLLLEIALAITNLYYHKKSLKIKSLMIGKFKTVLLFILIILGYIGIIFPKINFLVNGFKLSTINLQILSLISYFRYYIENMEKEKIESINTEDTIVAENLVDLTKKYGLYTSDDKENY